MEVDPYRKSIRTPRVPPIVIVQSDSASFQYRHLANSAMELVEKVLNLRVPNLNEEINI